MRNAALIVCLWPGLPGLWTRGLLSGLSSAVAFAMLLNAALAASFLWPELVGWTLNATAWALVLLFWGLGTWWNVRRLANPNENSEQIESAQDLFPTAQTEYLKGDLYQAELLLKRQLVSSPDDPESRLLLATLQRRAGRLEEADHQFKRLQQAEASKNWKFEIDRELEFLKQDKSERDHEESSLPPDSSAATSPPRQSSDAA